VATEAAWLNGKKEKNSGKEQKKLLTWIGLLMEEPRTLRKKNGGKPPWIAPEIVAFRITARA
jgi:hypothetical protein